MVPLSPLPTAWHHSAEGYGETTRRLPTDKNQFRTKPYSSLAVSVSVTCMVRPSSDPPTYQRQAVRIQRKYRSPELCHTVRFQLLLRHIK